jgi:acyl carrier protein
VAFAQELGMNGSSSHARAVLAQALNIAVEKVGDTARIGELESWDSLGHMRLVLAIEQHLGRELSAEEIVELASLADVQKLLASPDRQSDLTGLNLE